ncbi:radical SAM/SPASM domain-containing protein [Candidatus Magnetobacterium casense]|uniref:SPASM domain-containing protein n=1 Tax=Candidatus Magnetobacterium casense TaxID=1455061 RepID=A0ABS6S2U9_9BACT|nr:radical SAM protein [Candidatus Magnetobacterium casensis]MBV6343161.1 SPASM domain-containing protein [Candidatus Magnetobacterium casensis]
MNSRQLVHWGLSSLSAAVKAERNSGLPVHLTVEPTNICNLHCPVCETGAGILGRPKGYMSLDNFKKILDSVGDQVNTMLFYGMGESFLNRDAYDMIRYATGKGIYVSACTNGEILDIDKLVGSGLSEISFQISGLSQETHAQYRVGGNLSKTLANLSAAIEAKAKGRMSTKVQVGFIVMKHNEHEIKQVTNLKKLGADEVLIIAPCVRTVEQGKKFMPAEDKYWYYDREAFSREVLVPRKVPHNRCWWIYYSTVVWWDGDVVPCCRDARGEHVMGNVLNQPFADIWNGERYREFRLAVSRVQGLMLLCKLCSGYGIPRLY